MLNIGDDSEMAQEVRYIDCAVGNGSVWVKNRLQQGGFYLGTAPHESRVGATEELTRSPQPETSNRACPTFNLTHAGGAGG